MTNVHYIHGIPEVGTIDIWGEIQKEPTCLFSYKVTSFSVARNRNSYDILGLVPHLWKLFVRSDTDVDWFASLEKKSVVIGVQTSLENLTAALYEIGHARDMDCTTLVERAFIGERRERYEKEQSTLKDCSLILSEECIAWDFALQELQRMNLGRDAMVLAYCTTHESVRSYVHRMVYTFSKRFAQDEGKNPKDVRAEILDQHNRWHNEMKQKYGVGK